MERDANIIMEVLYSNKTYKVKRKGGLWTLKIIQLGISDIKDIIGLDSLINLEALDLRGNMISEIRGLEELKNLKILDVNHNIITEINGLVNLSNLTTLDLSHNKIDKIQGLENCLYLSDLSIYGNPIYSWAKQHFGTNRSGKFVNSQLVVKYCRKSKGLSTSNLDNINSNPYPDKELNLRPICLILFTIITVIFAIITHILVYGL